MPDALPTLRLQVVERELSELTPYVRNAKKHPRRQIEALAKLIKRVGFRFPIAIDERGEIIAGHGRLLAAQELGMQSVPCIVHTGLAPEQVKALRLADNRLAELAETDDDLLSQELADLAAQGVALDEVGYSDAELNDLLKDDAAADDAPASDESSKLTDDWSILIECESEAEQLRLLEKFGQEGLKCRALI